MKARRILVPLAAVALLVWTAGCEKKETTVQDQANGAAKAVKETATKAVDEVAQKAKEIAAPASAKAQGLIDSAKKLVSEGKFQEALAKLKEIGSEKLSVDQQSIVDALKAQIEKALGATSKAATDAAGAAGGLVPKK